jgi:hypothetical protein
MFSFSPIIFRRSVSKISYLRSVQSGREQKKAVCSGLPEKIRGARVVMKTRERALLVR